MTPEQREKMIEAAARAKCKHRGYDQDSWPMFAGEMKAAIAAVEPMIRADERERCAKVATTSCPYGGHDCSGGWSVADAIRGGE